MSNIEKIESIDEYVRIAKSFKSTFGLTKASINPWFRGHNNHTYELKPTLYRIGNEIIRVCEREILRDFKLKSRAYINSSDLKTDIECMILMQHYGVPTRLLDWSESYLVALFFAVSNIKDDNDCCVWVLNPWKINKNIMSVMKKSIISPDNAELKDWLLNSENKIEGQFPVAIRAPMNSNRILGQRGLFTLFGELDDSLNELFPPSEKACAKIIIQGNKKLEILKELFEAGITHSTILPELKGICEEITFRFSSYLGEDSFDWNDPANRSESVIQNL